MDELDAELVVPRAMASEIEAILRDAGEFEPDSMLASGAEGGGENTSIILRLAKEGTAVLAKVVQRFSAGSDIKLVIGQTTLDAKRLNQPNVGRLIKITLDAELARSRAQDR